MARLWHRNLHRGGDLISAQKKKHAFMMVGWSLSGWDTRGRRWYWRIRDRRAVKAAQDVGWIAGLG